MSFTMDLTNKLDIALLVQYSALGGAASLGTRGFHRRRRAFSGLCCP